MGLTRQLCGGLSLVKGPRNFGPPNARIDLRDSLQNSQGQIARSVVGDHETIDADLIEKIPDTDRQNALLVSDHHDSSENHSGSVNDCGLRAWQTRRR